jgi:hypothetical protein
MPTLRLIRKYIINIHGTIIDHYVSAKYNPYITLDVDLTDEEYTLSNREVEGFHKNLGIRVGLTAPARHLTINMELEVSNG